MTRKAAMRAIPILLLTFALCAQDELPQLDTVALAPPTSAALPPSSDELSTEIPRDDAVSAPLDVILTDTSGVVSPPFAVEEMNSESLIASSNRLAEKVSSPKDSNGYTINYNTVSIQEYLRFASKVCNTNFIFNNEELDFTVTVVSDAPITPENVMATLLQVLRIHGFILLEQDNNLVIHKAQDVKQIATLVTESGQGGNAAILTRVFRITHAKPDVLAGIIRPMISSAALLEVSPETHQLILTDIRTTVEKVAALIEILDSPAMPIETATYEVVNNSADTLIPLTTQIMAPMIQGRSFSLIPNALSNTIYIVSSPDLIQKAFSVLKTIDIPAKQSVLAERRLKSENIFIYKPINKSGNELLKGLEDVSANLRKSGLTEGDLIPTIESARWISESNSIMFVGSQPSVDKIKEILQSLDVRTSQPGEETSFFIYRPQNRSATEIQGAISEMTKNLKDSKITDKDLIYTLNSAKVNEAANSLTFSGEERTFTGVRELLTLVDVKGPTKPSAVRRSFYLYKPQHLQASDIEASLKDFAATLDKSKAPDVSLIDTINGMQVITSNNAILFTGTDADLKRLQEILPTFDIIQAGVGSQFFVYKPKTIRGEQLAASLKELTENLQSSQFSDPGLLRALQSVKYVKSTNSFLFTGDSGSLKKVEDLISTIDTNANMKGEKKFIIYEPKYAPKEKIDAYLKQLSDNLSKKGGSDDLLTAIRSIKWMEVSHSYIIHGNDNTLTQLHTLLENFDTPAQGQANNFFLYKPENLPANQVLKSLQDVSENLKKSGYGDPSLINAIDTAQYAETSQSLVFTGSPDTIQKIQSLLKDIDIGGGPVEYSIYKVKNRSAEGLKTDLEGLTQNFASSGLKDLKMVDVIKNMRVVKETNSLLMTGDRKAIEETKQLIVQYDTAVAPSNNFFLYKPRFVTSDQLMKSLQDISTNLKKSNLSDPALIQAIDSAKYVETTQSVVFTGNPDTIQKIQALLKDIDNESLAKTGPGSSNFFLYKPQYISASQVMKSLQDISTNLKKSDLTDPNLIQSIDTAKYVETTQSIVFTGNPDTIQKIQTILKDVDNAAMSHPATQGYFLYKVQNRTADGIKEDLNNLIKDFASSGLKDLKVVDVIKNLRVVKETNSIFITGDQTAINETKTLIAQYDTPQKPGEGFFIYKPQYVTPTQLQKSLQDLADNLKKSNLPDTALINSITNVRFAAASDSIIFTGNPDTIQKVQAILKDLDNPGLAAQPKSGYYLYKVQHTSGDLIQADLNNLAKNFASSGLKDTKIIDVIQNIRYMKDTNSLLLTGDPKAIDEIKELIGQYDYVRAGKQMSGYYLYKVQNTSAEMIQGELNNLAKNFTSSGLKDTKIIDVIQNMRYIKDSNSLLLTGDQNAIDEVKELIGQYDVIRPEASNFFMYKPQSVSAIQLQKSLRDTADNMKKSNLSDPNLINAIQTVKYTETSNTFLFTGSPETIQKVQAILKDLDAGGAQKPGYYIYKVEHTTGDVIEEDLDNLAKNFASSGLKDAKILDVIKNIRYIKETNSLLLTGDPQAIEETKELIGQYDYPRTTAPRGASNFFMYKPQHVSAVQLQKSLSDVAENLKKADLADPNLLNAIHTAKYVETTNSIIFTGTQDTIQKIQGLLKDIDIPSSTHAPIQHIGQTTFLLYKLKNASGSQIITSLQNMLADLKKSHASDKSFLTALGTMKYIRETNSLLFTGDEEALKKVELLVEQFDVTSLGSPAPRVKTTVSTDYFLYKPQSVPGTELEHSLRDFAENLKQSGHNDPELYDTIESARWIEKTQNLMFTGTTRSLDRVRDLLKLFDIASNAPQTEFAEPSIQSIDNTSFLVYKLQFHKGDEIQGALRQIAKDMSNSTTQVNQNLFNSINSLQWLEMTNSLLCSGDGETLTRLKELIKSLDIPLKQVFIEILVVETTLTNALNFGLEWGSNFNFRNQYSGSTFNTAPSSATSTAPSTFDTNLAKLAPPTTPTPQLIPTPAGGFDLGIIGEVIKHNGETYLTLGSLLTALQTDAETTIVMTPKIIAQDGKTASLFQGNNIPFTGSFVTNSSQSTVQTANIEYRDIGMNLTVTPVLGNSDIVTLDINFDQSQTTGSSAGTVQIGGSSVSTGLVTSKTTMQTTVHVPDKHFLILTGNVNNSNTRTKSGIPCLGGLPLIGAAFSSTSDAVNNTNIVVFLRPHILTSKDDMLRLNRDQEEFFRDQGGTPFLQHNYDEAMDYVKSVNDE